MSQHVDAGEITLPIKRTEGDTLEGRLTDNAYYNILPARYLRKDANGDVAEAQEDLFDRVAKNIALAEAVFEADNEDIEVTVTPDQLKPDHPRRDELAAEVFGTGTTAADDVETALTEYNVNKFAYETVVPELPEVVREHVEETAADFRAAMEDLSFMPNSPTLMNAGDELQQLSACFVDSPEDDIDNIHQTAKEAAQVFQCLIADTHVHVDGKGVVSIADVEPGDEIRQRDGDGHRTQRVEETHAYDDAPVARLETEAGIDLTGTPNHELLVDGEWTRIDEIESGDTLTVRLGWLPDADETTELTSVASGGRWTEARTVSNDAILELYAEGHSDYEIAAELGVHATSVGQYRQQQSLEPNGQPVKAVTQPTQLTTDLAELVGMWVGDGSKHEDGIRFHLNREENLEHADRLCRRLFDEGLDWRWDEGCYDAVLHSHEIKRWWLANFGDAKPDAASASVPEQVWRADHETVAAFLRGLFSTDGSLQKEQYPRLWTASEDLLDGVQQLLLGLGIPAMTWEYDSEDREYYNVGPTGEVGLCSFADWVGFIDARDDEIARTLDETTFRGTTVGTVRDDTWEVPVETVEEVGTSTVYDVTVADDPEYVANSVVSHNSGGGMGYAFWRLRPYGDPVGSTGGIASGPITFMRTYDQMCETIAQGGARRGAQMGVMRVSHPDVIQFIHAKNKDVSLAHTLRLNDPDDFTHNSFADALEEARELIDDEGRVPKHLRNAVEGHLSNFNISVGVTHDFMEAVKEGEEYTFTSPRTGEPHVATEQTVELYEMFDLGEYVEAGEVLSVPAEEIWERIVEGAHENGEPGVIYLERVNDEHSFDVEAHPGHRILATNPCVTGETEIALADGTTERMATLAENGQDVRVLCRNTETDELAVKVGRNPRQTRADADLVRVETDDGTTLTCTPDHEVWTPEGYVEAGSLSAGDTIVGTTAVVIPAGTVSETVSERLTVTSVSDAGSAPVYNITVDDHHNYLAITEGDDDAPFVSVANCGEQPLEEYEACNLGHINLSTLAAEDAPDWRVWADRHTGEYDSQAGAITAFLEAAVDWEEFDRRIELGTRFLENVVTMSDFPVDEIEQTVREMRKIGLGIMGLAQLYIQLGMKYGSDPANEVARQLMTHINHHSKWTSHELATERGSFAEWDNSKYADPTAYREWFEGQTGLDAEEWADGFAIRNHNTTTIAPTGTTSMVGNTTGGCEPIYNVAYYKNVSDDVQGDEMLVEFDDYFLRVLEANDIDVEAVKREAQEQMAENEFDGIDGLTSVPDAIGELFVTTGDLSAKEHAGVQTACQEGVDSAISKTVNAPNDSTIEDAKEVFQYIYDHGGKGVTYYRDGTRSKQVLTTRAKNTEFADEAEAAEALVEQIEEVFGSIEAFAESEEVRAVVDDQVAEVLGSVDGREEFAQKRDRPDVLRGVTQRIDTGYGKLYVNINEDPEADRPFELFANIGNSGGFTASFTEALAKTISTALRAGVDPREIAEELQGIRSPKVAWDKGEQIQSIPDAIGTAMRRYLEGDIERAYPQQQTLEETAEDAEEPESRGERDATPGPDIGGVEPEPEADGGAAAAADSDQQSLVEAGESPECPECGSLSLYYSEGCKTCESCGWSEC
jgi:ribonucleotide reductase alpha subunit